ncbi:MAG: molybdopterin molybdotransferase MoeA [Rhodospirillales bacterium]|jgi:molybdopterin molybdotransferase|nr:molybdopterin molybdotransferase MoeA [Rhodospirillales bacterium]
MLSVAEAVAKVVSGFAPLAVETIGVGDALGRALAEDVAARLDSPPLDVSAMDGYAVRAADATVAAARLALIGVSSAGHPFPGSIGPGQCVRIFTGAAVPAGADAIVIQEDTTAEGDVVTVNEAPRPGRWIRRAGMDFRRGDVMLRAGRRLTGRDIGLAAAMNVPWLSVRRQPRVAILATGDELVMPGDPLAEGQIVGSNGLAVAAYVTAFGGLPVLLGTAADDEDSLRRYLAGACGADLLVTIGGASVGDLDLVRQVLADQGFDLGFYRVAMRPGKPLIFGRLGDVPVLGLPGNPVSAGVTSLLFLRPAIRAMLGLGDRQEPLPMAWLGRDLPANDHRQDYLRSRLTVSDDGRHVATPFETQDSALMARFAEADCLVVRPPNAPPARAGDRVAIVPLDADGIFV